jgi:hypothetical protein
VEQLEQTQLPYIGNELDIFLHAKQWKEYWGSSLQEWIQGAVLEVGAGLGANTSLLYNPRVRSWDCLEPDEQLASRLREVAEGIQGCTVTNGTIQSVSGKRYDCVLYIDVLEHIEDDHGELERAAGVLRPGGKLIVLSPAHQFLYSPFDKAIGHYRRYSRKTLSACSPRQCRLHTIKFLDSAGMILSVANRLLLRQSLPTLGQIQFWDRYVVPVSKTVDPMLGFRLGKSIVGVWSKT